MLNPKKISVFFMCLLFLMVQGCKPAPALEEVIYDMHAEEQDKNKDMIENNQNNEDEDDSIAPVQTDDTEDNARDRVRDIPDSAENTDDYNGMTAENIVTEINISPVGEISTDYENFGTNNGDGLSKQLNQGSNVNNDSQDSSKTQETQPEDAPYIRDNEALKRIVNVNGKEIEIPKYVDRVSAVGEAAVLVNMLGGRNRLVASSESLISNNISLQYFYDRAEIKPEILWQSSGVSELDSESFEKLISLNPQICFEISGQNTFSEEQIQSLNQNGIIYMVIPKLNTWDNIKQAVTIIGEVLGDLSGESGKNAPKAAQDYIEYADSIIKDLSSRVDRATYNLIDFNNDKNQNQVKKFDSSNNDTSNGTFHGKYSLYINYWDSNAEYSIYNSTNVFMSGTGFAVTKSGYSYSPLSYYMSLAGIINTSAMYPDFGQTLNWYVNPMIPSTKSVQINGSFTVPNGYYLTLTDNDLSNNSGMRTNGLGNDALYPAIIVETQTIKENIIASDLWQSYGYVQSASGVSQNFGYLDRDGGIIESSIIDDYEIYVNPHGLSNWSSGSAESILEPIWLAWKFYDAYSENEVRDEIRNFYLRFYEINLSETEISEILNGLI